MRETRLFDYTIPEEAGAFLNQDITVPTFSAPSPFVPGSWAGLVDKAISWRVEGGSTLVFEDILTRKGLCLNFSSPLTCRPLLLASAAPRNAIILFAACHTDRKGCTLLRIRINSALESLSAEAPCEELGRLALSGITVTAIVNIDGDVLLGLSDGRCALVNDDADLPRTIDLRPFSPTNALRASRRGDPGENTSMISLASSDSGRSHRSAASSMSIGIMSRIFGSPRGNTGGGRFSEGASMDHSHMALSGHLRDSLRPYSGTGDGVLALARVKFDGKAVASLHRSGRVCLFVAEEYNYQFVGDTALPMKLSTANVDQFLLTGLNASTVAVVMVDEDPSADSLRVYNITCKVRQNRTVALSCTPIAKRDGPVGRVVSAVFTGDDVLVGTESGSLSGLLNVSSERDSGVGIPTGTIWTAMEDVDKSFGLGRTLDEAAATLKAPLSIAYRFSPYATAKAMRRPNPVSATRAEIRDALQALEFPEDEENTWKRMRSRAEQITKLEDLKVRDMCLIDEVGIIVTRQSSMFVLRGLAEAERKAFGNCSHLLNDKTALASGTIAALLSSHAACQVLACQVLASQYRVESVVGNARQSLAFMLNMCSRFSEEVPSVPLADIVAAKATINEVRTESGVPNLASAVTSVLSALEPGGKLLKSLLACAEMEALSIAAEQSVDLLPISSMFARGVACLSMYRKASAISSIETDIDGPQEDAVAQEDDRLNAMLDKAYGFLITATHWCDEEKSEGDEDAQCAIVLAGLSNAKPASSGQSRFDRTSAMTDSPTPSYTSLLPNGPNERLVRDNLGFWLLERSVRLLESSGAPKSAAAAALEAMTRAPDRKRHEMMRAAAFSRFLDAGEFNFALTAILNKPYAGGEDSVINVEESGALRDAIGLFVNATADRGMLQWLAEYNLPEPLRVLCGQALERRARAADALQVSEYLHRKRLSIDPLYDEERVEEDDERPVAEYELLYSWHMLRGDESSAATAALEWSERLSVEGLAAVRGVINGKPPVISIEQQIRLLLLWTRTKLDALTLASSAAMLQPPKRRYIARSRFSILSQGQGHRNAAVVDMSWVSRRHLLAHAQSRCLTRLQSECEQGEARDLHFLISQGSKALDETKEGVAWVSQILSKYPSYDNFLACVELCMAWREEIGGVPLIQIIQSAAHYASRKDISGFEYAQLEELLRASVATSDPKRPSPSWYQIAFESALSASSGAVACPQWLVDAAAWGTEAYREGTEASQRQFAGRGGGDAVGVVRTFLRYNRPVDAAKALLAGLDGQKEATGETCYVPYAAIDATLETLLQMSDDYPDAEIYHEKLKKSTEDHMNRIADNVDDQAETVMTNGNGDANSTRVDQLVNSNGATMELTAV